MLSRYLVDGELPLFKLQGFLTESQTACTLGILVKKVIPGGLIIGVSQIETRHPDGMIIGIPCTEIDSAAEISRFSRLLF